jgi:hypothetical protein
MTPTNSSRPVLPSFGRLAGSAAAANAPLVLWLLMTGHGRPVYSLLAAFVMGMAVFGSLYLFVGRGLDPFVRAHRGQAKPATGSATFAFALLLPLKYLVLGGLLWLMWHTGHLSLLWFIVGFLITQISVTVTAAAQLSRRPRA